MLSIQRINFFEYLAAYSTHFPISLTFYGKKVIESKDGGTILLATEDNNPRGMVFASIENHVFSIYLISVIDSTFSSAPARIASCENEYIEVEAVLLNECIRLAVKGGLHSVCYHCTDSITSANSREYRLTQMGFNQKCHISSYRLPLAEKYLESWKAYEQKTEDTIVQRLRKKGYELRTFEQCETAILEKMYGLIGVVFSEKLDPRTVSKLLTDYSSVVLFNNEPVTFCTISSEGNGGTITVEQLSTRVDFRNNGTLVMPLSYAINRARANGVNFVKFDINSSNSAMLHILQKLVLPIDRYKACYCKYTLSSTLQCMP